MRSVSYTIGEHSSVLYEERSDQQTADAADEDDEERSDRQTADAADEDDEDHAESQHQDLCEVCRVHTSHTRNLNKVMQLDHINR